MDPNQNIASEIKHNIRYLLNEQFHLETKLKALALLFFTLSSVFFQNRKVFSLFCWSIGQRQQTLQCGSWECLVTEIISGVLQVQVKREGGSVLFGYFVL